VEAATARTQEVEQKLRLTKQRLAEGALTEAATALGYALELDNANAQAKELRRQIDDERNRRERRKKLSEVLHHARTLWTALDYDGCLKVISEALRDFPADTELLKLQEMARHDLEDLDKQRQLGEVRKLLGQLEFASARKIIEAMAVKHPQDSAVKNLRGLVLDAEREQQKSNRFIEELAGLRALLTAGKFADAVVRGNALLREYPEEFELKELLDYATGEQRHQEQRQKEKAWEKQIRELIEGEKYREAESSARRAAQEFPKLELFRALAEEAGQKRQAQEKHERARQEMMKRVREIDSQIQKNKISDAIALAQQTLVQMGQDPQVTQLLNVATLKQQERKKKDQEQQFAAAKTMVEAGNFAGATQMLNQALAARIFEQSDPRVQERLREIDRLSSEASGKTPASRGDVARPSDALRPSPLFSATLVAGAGASATRPVSDAAPRVGGEKRTAHERLSARPQAADALRESGKAADASKDAVKQFVHSFTAKAPILLQSVTHALRKPAVFGSIAAVTLILIAVTVIGAHKSPPKNRREKELRDRAEQLWVAHQLDESEQAWRQLQQLHGGFQKEAGDKLGEIEERRSREQQRFDQGMALKAQDVAAAKQVFQEVQDMNLWHVEDAKRELAALMVPPVPSTEDPGVQEKAHFDRGEQSFQSKNYDLARREFVAVRELNLPNSTVRPEADKYLKRIKQIVDDKNLFDSANQDIKNENWTEAHNKLQQLIERKSLLSGDARQRMGEISEVEKAQEEFTKSLQREAYGAAKNQVEAMTSWPKTKAALSQKLQAAQRRHLDEFESRANSLVEKGDADGLERLEDELRVFGTRAEDTDVKQGVKHFDEGLRPVIDKFRDDPEARKAFEAAVADFNKAKQNRDVKALDHSVKQQFQTLAAKKSRWQAAASAYVDSTIPNTIVELSKNPAGKILLPQLNCVGSGPSSAPVDPSLNTVSCAQLDAGLALQWNETYMLDFPDSANQPGKLPYTLKLIVTVDSSGKVKIEKDGNADKDFLKKAKDASKNWKTTIPKSGGKPVSVKFPLTITFQR
jgi:hypothetical protein